MTLDELEREETEIKRAMTDENLARGTASHYTRVSGSPTTVRQSTFATEKFPK